MDEAKGDFKEFKYVLTGKESSKAAKLVFNVD